MKTFLQKINHDLQSEYETFAFLKVEVKNQVEQTKRLEAKHAKEIKRLEAIYQQKLDAAVAWFAWGPPFVPTDAGKLVETIAKASAHATAFELCRTQEKRVVPALRISQLGAGSASDGDRVGIWIQARQHAWESGSSWVARGFIEWLISDDPQARELRKKSLIHFVPLMDVDNVARGAGGKAVS